MVFPQKTKGDDVICVDMFLRKLNRFLSKSRVLVAPYTTGGLLSKEEISKSGR